MTASGALKCNTVFRVALVAWAFTVGICALAAPAAATGLPEPWQIDFQQAASPVMEKVREFHVLLLIVQFGIVALVLGVLGYCIYRFNSKRNPVPSKTAHNTVLEVVWTALPIVILVIIAIPGLRLLYFHDKAHEFDMTLKVVGHQWYWSYVYPDHGGFEFTSIMVPDEELKQGQPRLLTVDNRVVLPVDTNVQILITSDDVIHNWAVPALGMKIDATPGRTNERWLRITKEGSYHGMCSELCGVNHAFMPIQIEAVSKEAFAAWVKQAQEQFAKAPGQDVKVASTGGEAR